MCIKAVNAVGGSIERLDKNIETLVYKNLSRSTALTVMKILRALPWDVAFSLSPFPLIVFSASCLLLRTFSRSTWEKVFPPQRRINMLNGLSMNLLGKVPAYAFAFIKTHQIPILGRIALTMIVAAIILRCVSRFEENQKPKIYSWKKQKPIFLRAKAL